MIFSIMILNSVCLIISPKLALSSTICTFNEDPMKYDIIISKIIIVATDGFISRSSFTNITSFFKWFGENLVIDETDIKVKGNQ